MVDLWKPRPPDRVGPFAGMTGLWAAATGGVSMFESGDGSRDPAGLGGVTWGTAGLGRDRRDAVLYRAGGVGRAIGRFVLGWVLGCLAICLSAPVQGAQADVDDRFDWSVADRLAAGVDWVAVQREYPNAAGLTCPNYLFFNAGRPRSLKLVAVRIDTRTPGLRWTTTGRAADWGQRMPEFRGQNLSEFKIRTQRQSTRQFIEAARMQGVPLVLAVNAAPWSPFQSGVAHPYADRMGLAVEQGQLICPSDGKRPSLVITREGAADLVVVEPDADSTQWQVAVSGFAFCLQDGLEVAADTVLHPRTGIGLCPDKRFVVWLVMDGRQAASQGATVQEVGQWLRYFGARDGLNMDGGGSTTLVRWGAEERRGIVMNRPAHGERSNGNNLGIALVEGGQE